MGSVWRNAWKKREHDLIGRFEDVAWLFKAFLDVGLDFQQRHLLAQRPVGPWSAGVNRVPRRSVIRASVGIVAVFANAPIYTDTRVPDWPEHPDEVLLGEQLRVCRAHQAAAREFINRDTR